MIPPKIIGAFLQAPPNLDNLSQSFARGHVNRSQRKSCEVSPVDEPDLDQQEFSPSKNLNIRYYSSQEDKDLTAPTNFSNQLNSNEYSANSGKQNLKSANTPRR